MASKGIRESIIERDQMYAEYLKEICSRFESRLSKALSEVVYDGEEVSIILENINIVLQNTNYVNVLVLAQKGKKFDPTQNHLANTISFSIPLEILENGASRS